MGCNPNLKLPRRFEFGATDWICLLINPTAAGVDMRPLFPAFRQSLAAFMGLILG
jgi:hypothetical protein